MSRTLTISDELYSRLEEEARARGFSSVEQLLEQWSASQAEAPHRKEVVRQIDILRHQLFAKYGQMPDSTRLLRQDRSR